MTAVEFMHPLRRSTDRKKVVAALFYLHRHLSTAEASTDQIRQVLKQARIPRSSTIDVAGILNRAGHLVDFSEICRGKRLWRLTDLGSNLIGTDSDLPAGSPPAQSVVTAEETPEANSVLSHKVIVELDLSRYIDIARNLEENLGAAAVRQLNEQIEHLVAIGLRSVGAKMSDTRLLNTGDGAILAFATALEASRFSETMHRVAQSHNREKTVELAQRHFRVGIYSGEIVLTKCFTQSGEFHSFKMAGTTIANAVRLESSATTGEVLISSDTWGDLPRDERKWFAPEEIVTGKREERLRIHRRKVVPPAPWDRD